MVVGGPYPSEWPATAPQLLGGGQERHDGAWGGCLAPGVAASCLPGVANFPTSSFQPSNGHPETSFRPILAREGAFEMGSGQSSCQHRPLRLRASRFGRSVNFPWTLGATCYMQAAHCHTPRPKTQSPNGNRISKLITAVYKVYRQDKTRHGRGFGPFLEPC